MKYFKYILLSVFISLSTIVLRSSDYALTNADQTEEVKLYPNPISNGAILTVDADKGIQRIEVMNIVGQILKIENYNETTSAKINIETFNEGIYFIKILFVDNTNTTKRFWVK